LFEQERIPFLPVPSENLINIFSAHMPISTIVPSTKMRMSLCGCIFTEWQKRRHSASGVRRKCSRGGFIQWHKVVICICCALFVTSQFDVIVLFPNIRFSEVR